MFKQKLFRSLVFLAALMSVFTIWSSAPVAHAAHAASPNQKSFSVAGGTISGPVIPATNSSSSRMAQAHAVSFQANTATLIPSTIKYFTVVGQAAKNGLYTYPYVMTLTQHRNTMVAIELSIDAQTHTQLIAVGTPTTQALLQHDKMPQHQGTSKQQNAISNNKSASSNVVPFGSGTNSVKYTTDWYDPIGIEVNALTDYLTFSYNGRTTSYINGSDSRWWLSDDGWVEQSHSIYGWNYWGGNVRTYVYTDDIFANTPFCAGQTTYVYDTQNTAEGLNNGSVMGFEDFAEAAGGCSDLLHYSSWLN